MQQRFLIIYLLVTLSCVFLHARSNFNRHRPRPESEIEERAVTSFTTEQRQVQHQLLADHNAYRAAHCAPALKLDDKLSRSAQEYAEELARTNTFEHSTLTDLGENLFLMESSRPITDLIAATKQASKGWYAEKNEYDFDTAVFSEETGHVTQLLWWETTHVGVGYATRKHGSKYKMFLVAHYLPPGNVDGLFYDNVLPVGCKH
ncbi:unnamed protein product [Adineta ricciae]|uniref:SCP domain-containing protein n=1 Tax=Adineta ricciae TaxID=249248 RepID=A0A814MDB4_ADIRI|nr:unnamed protein product [Adineta ricciae]